MVTIPYWFIRYGLPTGFLLLATAAILLARAAIHEPPDPPSLHPPAPPPALVRTKKPQVRSTRASAYSVRSGDTLGTIAERFGTTVDELIVMNPGIDPRALRVGQPLRVK
jgi:Tfp pilus assembly protein FimV